MPQNFDPRTAYQSDWRNVDLIEEYDFFPQDASLDQLTVKVLWHGGRNQTRAPVSGALSLETESQTATVWNPTLDANYRTENSLGAAVAFDPQLNDILRNNDGGWIIERVVDYLMGRWTLALIPERINVTA